MVCGAIVDNRPCCPKCSSMDAETIKIIDVDVAIIDKESYFELSARCRKCGMKFYYFLDTAMEERIVVDKKSDRYSRTIKESVHYTTEEEFDDY